jgi:two-component system NtrC family sensor kinase
VLHATTSSLVGEDGDDLGLIGTFRDVTEEYEQAHATESFLQHLVETLPVGIAVGDPETLEVRSANRAFCDLVGYEVEEILGMRPPYPWRTQEIPPLWRGLDSTLFRHRDGRLIPVDVQRFAVRSADGRPTALVGVYTDQSERRDFERRLLQSGKLAAVGELAAGVAHEINNPLFAILGLVEFLIAEAQPGTKAHERLQLIQQTGLEIKEIVRALLDFARERAEDRGVVAVADVLRSTTDLVRRTSSAKGVEVEEIYTPSPLHVDANANQLKQIFLNLLANARQAMSGGGKIRIALYREGDCAVVEVHDTGPGIPEELLPRIFEPFFTSKRDSGGSGLGLAVSLGIAQAHGGSLTARNDPAGGATFALRLPLLVNRAVAA